LVEEGFEGGIDASLFLWLLYRKSVKSWGCQNGEKDIRVM